MLLILHEENQCGQVAKLSSNVDVVAMVGGGLKDGELNIEADFLDTSKVDVMISLPAWLSRAIPDRSSKIFARLDEKNIRVALIVQKVVSVKCWSNRKGFLLLLHEVGSLIANSFKTMLSSRKSQID